MHIGDTRSFKARGACVLELEMRFGRINSRFRQKVTFWALFRSFWRRVTLLDQTNENVYGTWSIFAAPKRTRAAGHASANEGRGGAEWCPWEKAKNINKYKLLLLYNYNYYCYCYSNKYLLLLL